MNDWAEKIKWAMTAPTELHPDARECVEILRAEVLRLRGDSSLSQALNEGSGTYKP